jgi:hypothetical protein
LVKQDNAERRLIAKISIGDLILCSVRYKNESACQTEIVHGGAASSAPSKGSKIIGRGGRTLVASEGFTELPREQLAPIGRITTRRMFGKTGVFRGRLMFGMVTEDTLYLRGR